jgi:hypothetical protein
MEIIEGPTVTDPNVEPRKNQWKIELAFKLAD